MSGETEEDVSGWTVDTLHTHLQKQINLLHDEIDRRLTRLELILINRVEALEKLSDSQHGAQQEAVRAALLAVREMNQVQNDEVKAWRVSQNEWRAAMTDRETRFMPRDEALAIVASNTDRIGAVNTAMERRLEDLRITLDKLDKRMDLREGERAGTTTQEAAAGALRIQILMMAGVILSAIGLAVTVIIATR